MITPFLSEVELHERVWGTDVYSDRPALSEIMSAKIVAFWRYDRRDPGYRITLHETSEEIHRYITDLVLSSKTKAPARRLARLYLNQRRVRIKGVKVVYEVDGINP